MSALDLERLAACRVGAADHFVNKAPIRIEKRR
jgi:hypothetical protein